MKKIMIAVIVLFLSWTMMPDSTVNAQERLRYSRSTQIAEAFGKETLALFEKETGIKVELFTTSSTAAVSRLMFGFSDIASTTTELNLRHGDYGYVHTPFCKDPMAVIVNAQNPVDNISATQLQEIFSGHITNWKEVGGPDQDIFVAVPDEDTGAYKNFVSQVMKQKEMTYDFKTYLSTMDMDVVERFPWAISFITQGATVGHAALKKLKIDGRLPEDKDYPYYQTFYFVTRGEPAGPAKALIDFALSEKVKALMTAKGMLQVQQ